VTERDKTSFPERLSEAEAASAGLEEIYWKILKLRPSFPGAPLITIRPDWREDLPPKGAAADLFRRNLASAESILDVGAGNRYWKDVLARLGVTATYQSADIDPLHDHEFSDFVQVRSEFDAILMLEVIEHLPIEVGVRFLEHAARLLQPGGVLVVSTPNPAHPHRIWSIDFTHIRPWPAHDLWAVLHLLGLRDIALYRQMFTSAKRRFTMPLQRAVAKLLELDPAHGLLAFAHKPREY
jgi:SAM-dependent methyltransferase